VETPINPTGMALNIQEFADRAHSRGAILIVDATFGPPRLQDPFKHGADIVLHSGTKYIGGHSDMLCGILANSNLEWYNQLKKERVFLGGVMGSLEGWPGTRSMRTLQLRVVRQSESATNIVGWLDSAIRMDVEGLVGNELQAESSTVKAALCRIFHSSLQETDLKQGWLKHQMPNGFRPVFSICMKSRNMAKRVPSKLRLFSHSTSLGSVESLIEWRNMTDPDVDPTLLRLSIGVENWEDLKLDILQAFREVLKDEGAMSS
jgi:cystathionine beta-lyase/cystathionine gamma-synthase